MFKKMLGCFIASLSLLLSGVIFLFPNVGGDDDIEKNTVAEVTDTYFSSGNGSEESPYQISTTNDLIELSYLVNVGQTNSNGEKYSTLSYSLMTNVDLSSSYWTPIGTKENPFEGHFNGSYYSISNLKFNSVSLTGATSVGLFGNIKSAIIHNVIVNGVFENYDTSAEPLQVGVVVGYIEKSTRPSYIIDCHDDATRFNLSTMDDQILSIGYDIDSNGAVFKGDKVGILSTQGDIDKSIRLVNGQRYLYEGYVQRYYINSGALYKSVETTLGSNSFLYEEDTQTTVLMCLVNADYSGFEESPCSCYLGVKPLASVYDVSRAGQYYYREVGYAGTWIKEAGLTYTISKSAQNPLSISFDYGYPSSVTVNREYFADPQDSDETVRFKYGQSLKQWANDQYTTNGGFPFEAEKLGYNFNGFAVKGVNILSSLNDNDYIAVKPEGETSYINCFKGDNQRFYLDFIDQNNEIKTNIYFAMEFGENEDFFTDEKMADVIQRYQDENVYIRNFQEKLDNAIGIQTSGVGHEFVYTIQLKDGYKIRTQSYESDDVSITNNISNVISGVYYNFAYKTDFETRHGGGGYETTAKNSDSYDPSRVSISGSEITDEYCITVYANGDSSVVPGDICIIIERETFEVDLTPSLRGGEVDYTWEVEESFGASVRRESGYDILTCRYEDIPILKLTIGDSNQSIKGIEGNLIPVYGEFGFDINTISSLQFNEVVVDKDADSTIISGIIIDGFYDDMYDEESYITPPTYTQLRNYRTATHEHNFIDFTIGYNITIVGIENNLPADVSGNRIKHLGININTQEATYISGTGIKVDIVLTDILTITNNGYYEVEKIVVHTHYDVNYQPTTLSQTFEASSISNGKLAIGSIFTLPYDEEKGILDDYYTIEVFYKELTYDVIYKYTFNGEELTDLTNLNDLLSTYPSNQLKIKPDASGTGNIQFSPLGTKLASLKNTEISYTSVNADGFAQGSWEEELVINNGESQGFSWVMGTGDITVVFNFEFKKIDICSFKDAWIYHNSTYTHVQDVFENDLTYTLSFKYNFESKEIERDLNNSGWKENPKLKNTYWMDASEEKVWYDTQLSAVADIYQAEHIIRIIDKCLNEAGENVLASPYQYMFASPVIEYRTINTTYTLGNVDGGKFYSSDKQTTLASTYTTTAVLKRGDALPTTIYYNAAHSFSVWNTSIVSNIVIFAGNVFDMNETLWNTLFETTTYYTPNTSSIKNKSLILAAQWEKTVYKLTVDGIQTDVEIKLADEIAATYDGVRDGQAEIRVNGGEKILSGFKYGYVARGFKFVNGENSYTTTATLQLSDLNESEYFDTERLSISILRVAGIYKYYLALQNDGSGNNYFDYGWTDDALVDENGVSILNNEFIGKEGDSYFLKVPYGSYICNIINQITDKTGENLSFIRPGYIGYLNHYSIAGTNNAQTIQTFGWLTDFERNSSNYDIDYKIVPAYWVKDSYPEVATTSVLSFAYYGGNGNVARASFKYNGTSTTLEVEKILGNGDKITDFGFIVTNPSGVKTTHRGLTELDVLLVKGVAGNYKIDFFVEFIDTIDQYGFDEDNEKVTASTAKYTVNAGEKTLETRYNKLTRWIGGTGETRVESYYTGTSTIVVTENSQWGVLNLEFTLTGGDTAVYAPLEDYFTDFQIDGDNTVGKRYLIAKANEKTYNGFTLDEILGAEITSFGKAVTVVQTPIEIELIGSSYFVNNTILDVLKDVESTFTIAGNTFTYSIEGLSLELNDQLTQRVFGAGDEGKFICQGFKVLNSDGEDVTSNFTWKFSSTSNYILEEVEDVEKIETSYIAKWLITGEDGSLSDLQSTDTASITISSMTMGGKNLTKTTQGQTIFKNGNRDVAVVSQNGKEDVTVTIIKSALTGELKFTLIVNERAASFAYLGIGTSLLGEDYKDKFTSDTFGQDSLEMTFTSQSEIDETTTYIVFTNTDNGASEKEITIDINADIVLLSDGENIEIGSFVNDGKSVQNAGSFIQPYWIYNANVLSTWISPTRTGYQALGWAVLDGEDYVKLDVVKINDLLNNAEDGDTLVVYPIWQILKYNVSFTSSKLDSTISHTVNYYNELTQEILLQEGYKIKEVSYSNGLAVSGNDDTALIGQRRGTWSCEHILNSVIISFAIEDIKVKFIVENNPPPYVLQEVKKEESEFTYSSLETSTISLLPVFTFDGAYNMSGYGYKQSENILPLQTSTLLGVVRIFESQVYEDIEIELYAIWTPINYTIIFNVAEDETLIGNKTESATFGKAITNLSSARKDGFVFAGWIDRNGKAYTNIGDILTTIGTYNSIDLRWEIPLTSNWVSGEFEVTISSDEHVHLKDEQGNDVLNGSKYKITFGSANAKKITFTLDAGYSLITPTLEKGSVIVNGNIITISNLIEDQSLRIESSANENTISLELSNIEKVWVDGVIFTNESFTRRTGENVIIKVQAVDGYEFGSSFVPEIGNGEAISISNTGNTYQFTLTGTTESTNIVISAYAGENNIKIVDVSGAVDRFEVNGNKISSGASISAYTDTKVTLKVWLKYGYFNLVQTSSYTKLSVGKQEYDGRYYYEVEISGFTTDITLNFSAEKREFSFSVISTDESQGTITCPQEQTVKYGENITLNYSLDPNYLFVAWKDKNGNIVSEQEGQITLTVNETNFKKALLEEDDKYQIYAHFVIGRKDLTFDIKGKGSLLLVQESKEINEYIIAGSTDVETSVKKVYINHDVVITVIPDLGYEVDKLAVGLIEINSKENFENEEFVFNAEEQTITMSISRFGTSQFTIYFKPCAVNLTLLAGASVNGIEILGTTEGGSVYLSDNQGNVYASGDSIYKEYDGKIVDGAQYLIEGFADEDRYFVIKANEGFKAVISPVGVCTYTTIKVGETELHYLTGIRTNVEMKVIFVAQPRDVEFNFLIDGDAYTNIYAGKFTARTTDRLVYAYENNSPSVTVTAIHGRSITVDIYTSLSFYFDKDLSNGIQYSIVNTGEDGKPIEITSISVSNISSANYVKTGFREKATLTIDKVTTDAIIYIYVTPILYNVNFVDTNSGNVISLDECVVYGEKIDLSGLSTNEQTNFIPVWEKHTFVGYYTKDIAGSGSNQYIDPLGKPSNIWREHGYSYNGDVFEVDDNFDPQTNTFTLYSIFILNKAKINLTFVPEEALVGEEKALTISNVITNLSEMAAWITQGQPWYTEVSEGATLHLKALQFNNYKFVCWEVTRNSEDPVIYTTTTFTISNIQQGNYEIVAIYNPKIEIAILNSNTGKSEGGISIAYQDGQPLTDYYTVGKDLTIVATANEGFEFLYWIVENTGDFIKGYRMEGNVATYTFTQNLVEPIRLTAVFKGRDVSLRIYYAELEKYHDLNALYVNGEKTIFKGFLTITVAVGDEIKFELAKKNGYTFTVNGIHTEIVQDRVSELYYATGSIKISDLTDNGDGTYKLYIDFTVEREMIDFTFNLLLKDKVDEIELSKAGYLMFVDKTGKEVFVDGQTFTTLYADENKLLIYPSDNYRIKKATVYLGRRSYEVTSLINEGVLLIDKSFEDRYFSLTTKVEIEVERMIWGTEEFASPYFGKGDGSRENPYIIANAQDFALLAYLVNNGEKINGIPYSNLSYKVVSDIDFSGKFWEPIGTETYLFNGYIDLGSYTFKNISHYQKYENPETLYFGLFRYLGEDAEIVVVDRFVRNAIIVGICVGTAILLIAVVFFIAKRRKKKRLHKYATTN